MSIPGRIAELGRVGTDAQRKLAALEQVRMLVRSPSHRKDVDDSVLLELVSAAGFAVSHATPPSWWMSQLVKSGVECANAHITRLARVQRKIVHACQRHMRALKRVTPIHMTAPVRRKRVRYAS